jgi:Calcineurin-like phosphoesterase/K319L-like, PKD domain/PKD domain
VLVVPRVAPAPAAAPDVTVTAVSDPHVNAVDGVDSSQKAVAALVASIPSDAVLMPGDLSDTGTAADFNTFDSLYGSVRNKIRPAPGNHDFSGANGSAYFNDFGPSNGTVSTPWYSFDLGAWHIVSLAAAPDPGAPNYWSASSPQLQWLTADLDAHSGEPTLAEFHAPRYSGTEHGDNTDLTAIWNILYTHHVELALNGHDHVYQRFAPQNASGQPASDGVREIMVSTGGVAHYAMSDYTSGHNLQAWNNTDYGVTSLTLGSTSYSWKFTASDGSGWTDSGTSPVNPEHLASGNRAPVANAGPDQTVTAGSNGTANVTLNGTNSSDPDGDPLTYQWTENGTTLATTAQPTASLPVGTHTITLTVRDPGGLTSTDTVVITVNGIANRAPVANAGPDQMVTAGSNGTANVTLNGTNSSDPDGDPLTYQWTENGTTLASIAQPTASLPVGTHTITLTVRDPGGLTSTDTVVITVNGIRTMHVAALTDSSSNVDRRSWQPAVTVRIVDGSAQPVYRARVSFRVSGLVNASTSCTTGSNGTCRAAVSSTRRQGTVTFTVTNVTATGRTYQPIGNVVSGISVTH